MYSGGENLYQNYLSQTYTVTVVLKASLQLPELNVFSLKINELI